MIGRLVISDTDSTRDNKLNVSSLKNGIYLGFINDQKQFKFIKKITRDIIFEVKN
ncbi:MAG: hypothetical protein ACI93N_001977 [Flavobacteriaceae bacterium]|jgi:hypothetical protein